MKKKHIVKNRTREYGYGDCYLYRIYCSCGKVFGAWIPQKAEEEFNKHKEVNL